MMMSPLLWSRKLQISGVSRAAVLHNMMTQFKLLIKSTELWREGGWREDGWQIVLTTCDGVSSWCTFFDARLAVTHTWTWLPLKKLDNIFQLSLLDQCQRTFGNIYSGVYNCSNALVWRLTRVNMAVWSCIKITTLLFRWEELHRVLGGWGEVWMAPAAQMECQERDNCNQPPLVLILLRR